MVQSTTASSRHCRDMTLNVQLERPNKQHIVNIQVYFCMHWHNDILINMLNESNVGWLFVFYVPSTARSLRDGTPIYCPLRRT